MELPNHISDLVCCLEEQNADDDFIIRWCLDLIDRPRETMKVISYLDSGQRTLPQLNEFLHDNCN